MKPIDFTLTARKTAAREWIAVGCCLAMFAGMLVSRVVLSASMVLFFVNALRRDTFRAYWHAWRRNAFALLCAGFFFSYLISGLWSSNTAFWLSGTVNKLPFIILPFAFLSLPLHQVRYQRVLIWGVLLLQLAVIAYSLLQLGLNTSYYLEGYNFSRQIPTTKYNDHIRFSLSLVLSLLLIGYLLLERQQVPLGKGQRVMLVLAALVFLLYLHILAAKTGLLSLYLIATVYLIAKLWRRNRLVAVLLGGSVAVLPLLFYFLVPTFRTKIDYVIYEIDRSRKAERYDYKMSDEGRMITYEIGWVAIAKHPWLGVGAGDVMDVMSEGYKKMYPEVPPEQQYGPINQVMYTMLCLGVPLVLILVAMLLSPFFMNVPHRLYLALTGLAMLVSLMVEAMLELQFGVFTYLFFLWIWLVMPSGRKEAHL